MIAGGPVILVLAVVAAACGGNDRTLTVFAAASLTDVFQEFGAAFEEAHADVEVRFSFGGSQRLRLQLAQGAQADLFASANREQVEVAEGPCYLRFYDTKRHPLDKAKAKVLHQVPK